MRLFFSRRMIPQIVLFFNVFLLGQIAQTQEIQQDTPPDTKKMLEDPEFRRIFEELSVTKGGNSHLFDEKGECEWSLTPPKSPDPEDAQKPAPTFNAILTQHLAQMDRTKYLLAQNLISAEIYGFRKIDVTLSGETDFSQGSFISTSQSLDLAIHGDGFFVVKFRDDQIPAPTTLPLQLSHPSLPFTALPLSSPSPSLLYSSRLEIPGAGDGSPASQGGCARPKAAAHTGCGIKNAVFYTRCGHFYLTEQRKIALQHAGFSFLLQPEITVPLHAVSCEYRSNGDFLANMPSGSQLKIGELKLARFDLPKKLERLDGVLFRLMSGSGEPARGTPNETVQSGQLEMSNVDVAETFETYRRLHELQTLLLEKLK